ncbi:MAG: hypothetical protein DPW18_13765 [Chloroflexi bacterium]|nr:hypothetical protein [Chloroflexota bacterium]MDL1944458.1 hypothetical protein [Chloroflexi bacterium CFX2]
MLLLLSGDSCRHEGGQKADGTTGIVWLKWNVEKAQEMYNLTVDTAHTFFVGEGQWLVHNTCGDDIWEVASNLGEQSSRSPFAREIPGNVDDARNLFYDFSQNASEIIEYDSGMLRANFDDGMVVTFRSESSMYWSKGAPTIEINHPMKENILKLKFLGN